MCVGGGVLLLSILYISYFARLLASLNVDMKETGVFPGIVNGVEQDRRITGQVGWKRGGWKSEYLIRSKYNLRLV